MCVCVCVCVCLCVCVYPTPKYKQDATQGQFLSGFLQVLIKSFPSFGEVALRKLKLPIYATIYTSLCTIFTINAMCEMDI